ncbi:MAG TPA: MFS transporter, partial [Caulobacteraceae bacterium]|nr:MFS transporter [Caulobacteraceae bacterium]
MSEQYDGYPSLLRARFAQAVLVGIGFFTSLDIYVVGLLIEPIKLDLKLTDVQVGFANATAFFSVYGLLSTPMGMLADRFSRVRLLFLAMILWIAGLSIVGASHAVAFLVLGKGILGAANAVTYPAAMSLLSDYFSPDRRAMATSTYPVGQTLGTAGATLIGGLGYSALVRMVTANPQALHGLAPWRTVTLAFAAVGVVLLPAILLMREPVRQEVSRRKANGSIHELWSYRRVLIPTFAGIMFLSGAATGVSSWIAPALMRLYGQQPGQFAS